MVHNKCFSSCTHSVTQSFPTRHPPHLPSSLEPFQDLWDRARSSPGAWVAPPDRKGRGEPTRGPKSQDPLKGLASPSTGPEGIPAGSLGFPQAGPRQPQSPVTQNTGRESGLRADLALNLPSNAAPHLRSEEAGAQVSLPGQGPGRTHLPACGRRDPLTSAAPTPKRHRKGRSLFREKKQKESKKIAFAFIFLSTLPSFLLLTATTELRPPSGSVTQSAPLFLRRRQMEIRALES